MHQGRLRTLTTIAAVAIASLSIAACSGGGGGAAPSASDTPKAGGEITVGGLATSTLDPGQVGYSNQGRPYTLPILGSLFTPPLKAGEKVRPGLATDFAYNSDSTQLTLTLRDGAKFSDGTPVDAAAVVWNLQRDRTPGLNSTQYFTAVQDIQPSGTDKVVITFKQPYALLPDAFAFTVAGYLASPTAYQQLGADKFNQAPVGAGPFKVESVQPGQELVLVKNDSYWDAKHVYLNKVTWTNTGTDATAQSTLVKLQSGSIASAYFSGTSTAPVVLQSAQKDTSLSVLKTAATTYQILPVNTFQAPFNNLTARQAVAYCLDRDTLAKSVSQGFSEPTYVISGADSNYLKSPADGKKLNQYQYDPKKSKALVQQLGGLSFTLTSYVNSSVVQALQQDFAACGMDVKVNVTDAATTLVSNGNYQLGFLVSSSGYNPSLSTVFQDQNVALGKFGFKDDSITSLINSAKGESDQAKAKATWMQIWKAVSDEAVSIPLLSAPTYVVSSTCLKGVQTYTNNAGTFDNAYLAC